jgi:hypothetical protein
LPRAHDCSVEYLWAATGLDDDISVEFAIARLRNGRQPEIARCLPSHLTGLDYGHFGKHLRAKPSNQQTDHTSTEYDDPIADRNPGVPNAIDGGLQVRRENSPCGRDAWVDAARGLSRKFVNVAVTRECKYPIADRKSGSRLSDFGNLSHPAVPVPTRVRGSIGWPK